MKGRPEIEGRLKIEGKTESERKDLKLKGLNVK